MATTESVLKEALTLTATEKAQLIDRLMSSLDQPDGEIDALWAGEVEERIDAFDRGEIEAVSLDQVLHKYGS